MKKTSTLRQRIGLLVSQLRTNKKISALELARLADVSLNTVICIENGSLNPSLDTFAKVCDGLDLDLCSFFKMLEAQPQKSEKD